MILRHQRSAISTAVGIAAVVVAIVLIVAAYEVITVSSSTTTATVFSPTTSISTVAGPVTTTTATVTGPTSVSTSTVTTTSTSTSVVLSPVLSYSADAYATETTALLAGFSKATGIPVAPVISGGSNADASAIEAGAPDDIFISASLSATARPTLGASPPAGQSGSRLTRWSLPTRTRPSPTPRHPR